MFRISQNFAKNLIDLAKSGSVKSYLFDTDVIIDYLRGNEQGIFFFESYEHDFHTSAITIAELYSGVKGEKERQELEYFMSLFTVYPVTGKIAIEAGILQNRFFKSHGMGLADAMIAATAKEHGSTVISLNQKHFSMLDNLLIPYQK
jgi:predicted nucleic acid-binding protein